MVISKSFNGKFRDEFLSREVLDTVLEARVLTVRWRRDYNQVRPHSALGYRPPAPEAVEALPVGFATLRAQATTSENSNIQSGTKIGGRSD